ncbi:uncharacterized protein N0V89_002527 [Didymosphaeria variabile]|uniref:SPX domain-containing protein n=1 Tax=Didymosphaeria variabile TaxID=1932322 RepID=A0A9W9CEH1_9PLEO|nr:uncharacterized protein N0V89_002527 [Didymosphaeria variabile]KAJ4357950.1 hypothetical protein N0V89_002527 [Didymosphaeria variabile]
MGSLKALSIPGQGESSEKAFGGTFYRDLKAQHDRINLFVRSKSGEIERRLTHIHKSLTRLQSRRTQRGRLPASIVEKFAKIDADVNKAGEEIRALSRFQVAQRTGFRKILKKYKRWTKDAELERQFKSEVTSSPTSFYQLDLGYLLDQYIEVLGALRAPFDVAGASESPNGVKPSSPTVRISQTCQDGSELDFDVAFSLTPLGSRGSKATYWIHPDHIVEAEVLLLQHMRLITASSPPTTRGSPEATSLRRKSSTTTDRFLGSEDGVGLLVLDHPESFAIKQNASSLGSGEETAGTLQVKAAGNARWTSSGDAALALDLEKSPEAFLTAKLERKHLPGFLEISTPLAELNLPNTQGKDSSQLTADAETNVTAARQWLESHEGVRPIVGTGVTWSSEFVGSLYKRKQFGHVADQPQCLHRSGTAGSSQLSPPGTSGASTGGQTSPSALWNDTSATSAPEFVEEAPPLRAFRKKGKPSTVPEQPEPEQQRYWNEYDNPEDGDDGYYIYVDPDAEVKFPGQELFEELARKTRRLFGIKEEAAEDSSLSSAESSEDEDSPVTPPHGYGTFASSKAVPRRQGYFSGLLQKLRDPHHDVEALLTQRRETAREHRSLLRELDMRRHKAERTKLYFYTTCLAMAIVIDALLGTMVMTSRKKEVGVVDSVVLFGTIVNLLLGMVAIISMQTRETPGWVHKGGVYMIFAANVVVDVLFLIWVFRSF